MNINVGDLIKNKWVHVVAASSGAFVAGYILGKRRGDVFEVVVDASDLTPEQFAYADKVLSGHMHPIDYGDEIIEGTPVPIEDYTAVVKDQYVEDSSLIPDIAPKTSSLFAKEWDEAAESAYRQSNEIYVLHLDEYIRDERDYKQETVTYYAGDDIMADQLDTPIYNYPALMGDLKFGHGSNDPTAVYIRNERERREWEVVFHKGKFEIEVLGHSMEEELEDSIRHSSSRLRFKDA